MKPPAKIKLTKPGFEGYTGNFGPVHFTDGVSDYEVPFHLVNRIAGSTMVEYIDADGKSLGQAGPSVNILENTTTRLDAVDEIARQTEAEREREQQARVLAAEKPPVDKFYTLEELQKIADGGIKPLREIAKPWGVKDKSIPGLIKEILGAQGDYLKDRDQRRIKAGLVTGDAAAAAAGSGDDSPATEGQVSGRLQRLIDIAGAASIATAINDFGPNGETDPDAGDESKMRNLETEKAEREALEAEAAALRAKAEADAKAALEDKIEDGTVAAEQMGTETTDAPESEGEAKPESEGEGDDEKVESQADAEADAAKEQGE